MKTLALLLLCSPAWSQIIAVTPINSDTGQAITPTTLAASTATLSLDGASDAGAFPESPLQIFGNANTYLQEVIQNLSSGANASGNLIITNDLGGDTSFYLEIGINSSKFSQAQQTAEASSSTYITSSDSDLILWAGINGALNKGANERIIFGSSVPVTANASVMISSVGMVVGSLSQIGAPLDVVSTTQGIGIPVLTTAQVQAAAGTPKKAGQIIYNSTLSLPCISTGTTLQGYSRFTGVTTCQ